MSDREEAERLKVKNDGLRKLVDRLFNRWRWLKEETEVQLSTLRAENERLRERCEAAEYVANAPVNLMGDLICGKGVFIERVKLKHCSMWRAARRIQNMESVERLDMRESKTDAYADTIAAGWLPDSNTREGSET